MNNLIQNVNFSELIIFNFVYLWFAFYKISECFSFDCKTRFFVECILPQHKLHSPQIPTLVKCFTDP